MLFTNITFLFIFLPVFLLFYYLARNRGKDIVIIVGSLALYGFGAPVFLPLLLILALLDYMIGFGVSKFYSEKKVKNVLYAIGVAANLTAFVLLYLPYSFIGTTSNANGAVQPFGLVFYILSGLSYLTDIYQGKVKAQQKILDFLVYLTMFPKLLAGPVVCYHNFLSLMKHRKVTTNGVVRGVELFIRGFAKKVLLADNIGILTSSVAALNVHSLPALTAWIGILAELFQIYFDFAGYIDMARGIASMLGFVFPINFRSPFSAYSIKNFFTRWNISLIQWLKIYIGGIITKRDTRSNVVRLLLIGAGYALFLGGHVNHWIAVCYFLVLLLLEKFMHGRLKKISRIWRCLVTFLLVLFGTAFYFQPGFLQGMYYIAAMFGAGGSFFDTTSIYFFSTYGILLVVCLFCGNRFLRHYIYKFRRRYSKIYSVIRPIAFLVLFVVALCYSVANPNISFLCMLV